MTDLPQPSRGYIGYAAAILAGLVSASIYGVALLRADTYFIFLAYVTAVPLFLAGLGGGIYASFAASLVGFVALYTSQATTVALSFLIIFAVPSFLLTVFALRYRTGSDSHVYWYPEGYLLTIICLIPSVLFCIAFAGASDQEGGLLGVVTRTINTAFDPMKDKMDAEALLSLGNIVSLLAKYLPSMVGCSWVVVVLASFVIAQRSLQQQKWNIRSSFDYLGLHIPHWLVYPTSLSGLALAFAPAPYNYLGLNLFVLLCLPFFCVGLAITHVWAATTKMPNAVLTVFYVVMSFMMWPALFVILTGALDQWVNFRARLAVELKSNN